MDTPRKQKTKKKLKPWMKWVIGTASFFVVVGLIFIGVTYYYIKSIDIKDVAARHNSDVVDGSGEESSEPKKLPAIIEKPVEKASQLIGGEKIDSADALDVASILLNSGLSLKQISYLQGNATYDLSIEEKTKIRELLLSKLSDEEIELLRSITKQYGIGLNILNPDYPIEWVGERDPEKIKENKEAWEKMKQESNNSSQLVKPTDNEKPTEPEKKPTPELSTDLKKAKQSIDSKTESQLASLSGTCKAKSNTIVQQIVGSADGVTVEDLQNKYLGKVMEAEGSCDAQFQGIVSQAASSYADAGIDSRAMPDWNAKYEASKQSVRASAISAIAKAIKS
ncbi:hypothetical protein PghCCS26_54890 [Paenibacillus glycanilyticus]|uniref:Uncharacterized protein n=1 Tax=Paenibacillus glycanilyticus TaxID=126569 RepID=A0ABQ6NWL2_9BACL|nr:hypothetical protein [Paenibacillus glycanilyticus]GMK48359.1 hypothetical protein PghCCS26_54890 [Paenibacillus glycanilyticus]